MTDPTATKRSPSPTVPEELVLQRTLRAPRERVYRAWSSAKALAVWWGPDGFTTPRCEVDLRPGGALRIDMRGPDGTIYPMVGTFREVVPNERIAFVVTPLDDHGTPLFEVLNLVTFADSGPDTTVELRATVLSRTPAADMHLRGMEAGWSQQFGRLEKFVREEAA